MTGAEETGGTGSWHGRTGSATSRPPLQPAAKREQLQRARTRTASRRRRGRACSPSSSSRCPTTSTTTAKGEAGLLTYELIGKVAADHSHKWVFKEPPEQETSLISSWNNPADSQPRTWEAQFQSGIQTIALIAVREGVVQLGSMKKVTEDLSYAVTLRRKFGYLESIPGVLLPHPSSAGVFPDASAMPWPGMMPQIPPPDMYVDPYGAPVPGPAPMHIMPSMSSLEALLSKLPSVVPAPPQPPPGSMPAPTTVSAKEEELEEDYAHGVMDMSSSMPSNGAGESTSTSAAAPPMSSYFVDVGGKPGEAGF
ncbi:unnamed protein product [Alopecurus aequalis]